MFPARRRRKEVVPRRCKWCDEELERRDDESDGNWNKRITCGRRCASKLRELDKRDAREVGGSHLRGTDAPWGWTNG